MIDEDTDVDTHTHMHKIYMHMHTHTNIYHWQVNMRKCSISLEILELKLQYTPYYKWVLPVIPATWETGEVQIQGLPGLKISSRPALQLSETMLSKTLWG